MRACIAQRPVPKRFLKSVRTQVCDQSAIVLRIRAESHPFGGARAAQRGGSRRVTTIVTTLVHTTALLLA